MILEVKRTIFSDKSTLGKMSIDQFYFCDTLEDKDRHLEDGGEKVNGKTAIPRGTYDVVLRDSPKFGTVPWIKDVPGFEWVLIHWGNKPEDTEGCILVGDAAMEDWVGNSRATFRLLMGYISKSVKNNDNVSIRVS